MGKRIKDLSTSIASFRTGDVIVVDGPNGTVKMPKDNLLKETAQNTLNGNMAEEFVPNVTSAVAGNPYMYGGVLYFAKEDYSGAWNAAKFMKASAGAYIVSVDGKVRFTSSFKDFLRPGYIVTSGAVGSVVDLDAVTSSANYSHIVLDCFDYEKFVLKGTGASAPRLWCFVDAENKIISQAPQGTTYNIDTLVIAPAGARKIIVDVLNTTIGSGTFICEELISDKLNHAEDMGYRNVAQKSFKEDFVSGIIATNVDVGETVNLTPSTSISFKCCIVGCRQGDRFVLNGQGGSNGRLWAFVDSDNKLVSKSAADYTTTGPKELFAPKTSVKAIFNVTNSSYSSDTGVFTRSFYCDEIIGELNSIDSQINKNDAYISFKDSFSSGYIATNGAVGSVVDMTPASSTAWLYYIQTCSFGDKFIIKGQGGSTPRLWCFVDAENKIISQASVDATPAEPLELSIPRGAAKVIINVNSTSYNSEGSVFFKSCYLGDVLGIAQENSNKIDAIQSFKPSYEFSLVPQDFSAEIEGVDFSQSLTLETVYSKFEQLIEDFPDLVTKQDAAVVAGEGYPAYANGVGPGDPDYLETPAYKMFMYKISNTNAGAGNTENFKKKKLLIIAGQHGRETAAPFNSYLLAKKLCDATEKAAFSILSYFDVYIIPCVNGYGIYHVIRTNANGVNLNRNYPTPGWHIANEGTYDYTGPSAGSEFETKVVMAIVAELLPDMFIDHHNYDYMQGQFYTSTADKKLLDSIYNSLVNLSEHFIRLFPQYFGSYFRLLQLETATYSPRSAGLALGTSTSWFYSEYGGKGKVVTTIEICKRINYVNGEYSSAAGDYTNDAWKVGYMTLSEQLMRYSLLCFN